MNIDFFEVAADWADRRQVELSFFRDEYEGWHCRMAFSDNRGLFSGVLAQMTPRPKRLKKGEDGEKFEIPAETEEEFAKRVEDALLKECARVRERRIRTLNGIVAHKRAA